MQCNSIQLTVEVHTQLHICTCACMYVCIHNIQLYTCTCTCTHTHAIQTNTSSVTFTFFHKPISYIHVHIHVHVYTRCPANKTTSPCGLIPSLIISFPCLRKLSRGSKYSGLLSMRYAPVSSVALNQSEE